MKNRPTPIGHMLDWGKVSGGLLCTLYLALVAGFNSPNHLLNPSFLIALIFASCMIGSGLGMVLGFIEGIVLKSLMWGDSIRFTNEELKSRRKTIAPILFAVPIIINLLFIVPRYIINNFNAELLPLNSNYFLYVAIPTIIASLASIYATNHYLVRLKQWSMSKDARKSKVKNEEYYHLLETSANEESYYRLMDTNTDEDYAIEHSNLAQWSQK